MKAQLIIVAGGMGTRLGHAMPKAIVPIAGVPMVVRTIWRFESTGSPGPAQPLADGVIVSAPEDHVLLFEAILAENFANRRVRVVPGGKERQDSVANGLAALDADTDIVVIHDAARPFISNASIQASIDVAVEFGAATVGIPSIDTILEGDADGFLTDTPDRSRLWACQTPQTFQVAVIRAAHEAARQAGYLGTDDGSLVRRNGGRVKLVMGSPLNFKVTTPADLALAEAVVERGLA